MMRRPALLFLVASCVQSRAAAPPATVTATAATPAAPAPASTPAAFRLRLCTDPPVHLQGPPGAPQSRGCVTTFLQHLSDPATIQALGATDVQRRALIYAPARLVPRPVPVVLVFPGYSTSSEAIAFYDTHTRFETLADRNGFVVVYGNGLPNPPTPREHASVPQVLRRTRDDGNGARNDPAG